VFLTYLVVTHFIKAFPTFIESSSHLSADITVFFFNFFNLHSGGWSPNWVHSARRPFTGEFGGMNGRGNRSTRRKPTPAPLCPPQIPLDQTRD
jgi:hypothetical protein